MSSEQINALNKVISQNNRAKYKKLGYRESTAENIALEDKWARMDREYRELHIKRITCRHT